MAEESDIDDILNKLDQLLKEGADGNDDADAQAEESGADAAGREMAGGEQDEPEHEDIFRMEALIEEEAPVEETPVEEMPVEDAPVEDAPVEDAPVEDALVDEAATQPEAVAQPAVEVAAEVPRVVLTEDMLMENPQTPLPLAFGDDEARHVTMVEDAEAAERKGGPQALPDEWVDRVSDAVIRRLAGILPQLIQEVMDEHAASLPTGESRQAEKDSER